MPTISITTVDGSVLDIADPGRLQEEIVRYEASALTLIDDLESGEASRVKAAIELYRALSERHSALTNLLPEFERRHAEVELIAEGRRVAEELRHRQNQT